jgi:hypothetical protein
MARGRSVFHGTEKLSPIFPRSGKTFAGFSTEWKKFRRIFHSVEKSFPQCGKIPWAAGIALALAWGAAGCATVKANRLAIPKAERWTATASEAAAGQGPECAIDGRADTAWRSGAADPQWLQVDLGRSAMVCGFSLQWNEPHATAYAVQTSPDGTHWALGFETDNGDGDWDQVSIEPTLARHVRVTVEKSLQGTGVALAALEIRGLADQPCAWVNGLADPAATALLDGEPGTTWRSAQADATVELDLRSVKPVGSVRVDWGAGGFASNVVVETSTNRADWTSVGRIQARAGDFDVVLNDEAVPARYVRLSFSGASSGAGFEVAGLTLRGAEGAARPWALLELAASHAPEGVYPDVFRRRQNYGRWRAARGGRRGRPTGRMGRVRAVAARGHAGAAAVRRRRSDFRAAGGGPGISAGRRRRAAAGNDVEAGVGAVAADPRAGEIGRRAPTAWVQYELANESIMAQTGRLCWVVRPVRLAPAQTKSSLAPIHKIRVAETDAAGRSCG